MASKAAIAERIDLAQVAERADLLAILERDGVEVRNGTAFCPFHDNHRTESFSVFRDGGRDRFKCHGAGCGVGGDAIAYVQLRDRLDSPVEAAKVLDPSLGERKATGRARREPPRPAVEPRPESKPVWHDPLWQEVVAELVDDAVANLWSQAGRPALDWVRSRGLKPATIRRFRLGYLPKDGWTRPAPRADGTTAGLWFPRGIAFPWIAPRADYDHADAGSPQFVGVNVRKLNPDPFEPWTAGEKNHALAGSQRGHAYPYAEILLSQGPTPALLLEGELDSLIGWQEAGHLVHAITVGGAQQEPRDSALAALAKCPTWLLGFDRDRAGAEAAWRWNERAPHKSHRVIVPHGKDLAEFHENGGDVAGWLRGELARLELDRPLAPTAVDPAVRFDAIQARMLGTSLEPDHRAEDLAYAQTERFEHRLANGIPGGDPGWWPMVANWPLDRQQEWSSVASGLIREARAEGRSLNAAEAERIAAEQMAEVPF